MDFRTLPKDCECCTHDGPHWMYEDRFAFEQNLRILQRGGMLCAKAFLDHEVIRLQNKLHWMAHYVKDETESCIFPDGYSEKDYDARSQAAVAELLARYGQ
jgi:hypothetical protein